MEERGPPPPQRWPNLLQPDVRQLQQMPVPAQPTSVAAGLREAGPGVEASAQLLQQVIRLLDPVQARSMHLVRPAPAVPPDVSPLQAQLAALAPGIFDAPAQSEPAQPMSTPASQQQPAIPRHSVNSGADAGPSPPTAAAASAPAPAPVAAATKPARLRHGGRNAAAAGQPPTEEAAAGAYAAYVAQLLAKHGRLLRANAEEDGEEDRPASMEEDGEEGNEDEEDTDFELGPSSSRSAHKQQALLADVRRLAEETMRVRQAGGALRRVDADLLVQLLQLLHALVGPGSKFVRADEQESGARVQSIHVALEASMAGLRILATPDLPQRVYNEDLLDAVVGLTKFQLAHNVYAFYDARFRGASRPPLFDEDEGEKPTGKQKPAKKGKSAAGLRLPKSVKALQDRCQSVLGLLGELLGVVPLHTGTLAPLVRVAMQALTVEGIPLLQAKATGLLVSAFQHYPTSRQAYMEDFFAHVMTYFTASKKAPRAFVCSEDSSSSIQMLTAAVLQMVQVSVELPAMDTEVKQLPKCYAPAVHWSDVFWSLCFDRLPAARATKSDTEQDFKLLLEQLLADLLVVACEPEWPAAAVLLLRFLTTLSGSKGLQHADTYVRQSCVDFLGQVSARLHQYQAAQQADAEWLQGVASSKGLTDPLDAASSLLLEFLSDKARGPMAASARRFLLTRTFAEEVTALQRQDAEEEEQRQLLVGFRQQQDVLDGFAGEAATAPGDARRLMLALVQKALGSARQSTVLWLLDALDPRQAPTTRAKAVKALGAVVEAEPSVLELADVQRAVERALQDDSISVREAALELLGRHISGNQRLAMRLFPTLAKASTDSGTSVRKRAIRILWECCIRVPGFPAATEACKHVLMRAGDAEESIQDMVSRVFHSLWFTPRLETGSGGAMVARSAAERAQQLAEVALAVYEAGGRGIHLPLDLTHPLVVVLRAALGFEAKGDLKKEWRAGREISQALLTAYLQAEEVAVAEASAPGGARQPADSGFPGFPYLLSLHALAVTDVELCMPSGNPAQFVQTLAPYLKAPAGAARLSEDGQRRGAEELLCTLHVLDSILDVLPSLDSLDLRELVADLTQLIHKASYVSVVGSACKCLCTIASKSAAAAPKLAELAAVYYSLLQQPANGQAGFAARFLFTLSHLCRYGADVIERTKPEGKELVTMQDCLSLFARYFQQQQGAPAAELKVRDAALQALGMLTIARPSIMTHSKAARAALQSALQSGAPQAFKVRALINLNELLLSDERQLMARQAESEGEGAQGSEKGGKKKKRKGGPVQAQCGQGDNLSLSSGILQEHWDSVLRLATDASPAVASPSASAASGGAAVRRQALALIETVLRGGLVAPWTAVAPLVALATDPAEDLRAKAMKLLKQEAEKRSDFLENKLPAGVVEAYQFHARLVQVGAARPPRGVLPKEVASGLRLLYKDLVQPNRALRTSFLQNLLKRFDTAAHAGPAGAAAGGAPSSASARHAPDLALLRFCASVAAELPYKRGDEPCSVVHQVNGIVARRGAGVLEDFKAALTNEDTAARSAAAPALCRASLALSMLLLLKDYLKKAYSINAERIAAFGPSGERRKQEERTPVGAVEGVPCHLGKLDLGAPEGAAEGEMRQQYKVFKQLMSNDAADYDHLNYAPAGRQRGGTPGSAEGAAGAAAAGAAEQGGAEDAAGTPEWVLGNGAGPTKPAAKRAKKAATTGAKAKAARGTAAGKAAAKTGPKQKRKRKKASDSDDPDDSDYDPAPTRKKLNL